jgi:hypothetical protein
MAAAWQKKFCNPRSATQLRFPSTGMDSAKRDRRSSQPVYGTVTLKEEVTCADVFTSVAVMVYW